MGRAPEEVAYLRAVLAASTVAADALLAMERVAELLAPERSAALAAEIETRCGEPLGAARAALAAAPISPASTKSSPPRFGMQTNASASSRASRVRRQRSAFRAF